MKPIHMSQTQFLVLLPAGLVPEGSLELPVEPYLGRTYRGIDRYAWSLLSDVDFEAARRQDLIVVSPSLGSEVTFDIDFARDVSARQGTAVSEFAAVKPGPSDDPPDAISNMEFCGYDIVSPGEWSLIKEGPFRSPDLFQSSFAHVNHHGLVRSFEACRHLQSRYFALMRGELVEPVRTDEQPVAAAVFLNTA